jgi:hypothetical protein
VSNSKQEPENFGVALYYPYIQVRDIDWLKCNLLYWDKVRRIVPTYLDQYNESLEKFVEAELLISTEPTAYRNAASELFIEDILPIVDDRERIEMKDAEMIFKNVPVAVHPGKITDSLREILYRKGLSHKNGIWLKMDPVVAGFYMICLASVMSDSLRAPMITDSGKFEIAGQYLSFGEPPAPLKQAVHKQDVLLKLGIPFPSKKDVSGLSLDNLLKFREKYSAERGQFRETIEGIKSMAASIQDANALSDYLNEQKQKIKQAVDEHKKALREVGVTALVSSLDITLPAIGTSIVSIMPQINSVSKLFLTISGFSLSAAAWWAKVRQAKREMIRSCPWHYLLPLEHLSRKRRFYDFLF